MKNLQIEYDLVTTAQLIIDGGGFTQRLLLWTVLVSTNTASGRAHPHNKVLLLA